MEQKFHVGDEVIVVAPKHRQIEPDFMDFMQSSIGKKVTILSALYNEFRTYDFPNWSYEVNLHGKPEHFFEDWFEFVDKTEVSFDKEQLTSLL